MLVRLLSVRKIFNKYDYEKDPVTAFAKMSLSKEGSKLLTVLWFMFDQRNHYK